ncbi:dienelactone hydrolase family protein [Alphaproteobacteria bacterium]|nr:dienelactone hydrolase family protein [Alphaproteobacteria bacterium]
MQNYVLNYFKSADDFSVPYYEYIPEENIKSSIVLVYEIFGITSHIHSFANLLAKKGYVVYLPDIFSRIEKGVNLNYDKSGFEKGIKLKEKLGWDYPVMDIVALASLLKQKYKVTCFGFCFGGSIAWRAIQKSFLFDKAVCYYGSSIPEFLDKKINNPTMVHFGELDQGISSEKVERVKKYSEFQNYELLIHEYEGADHGFNCEDRKSYDQKSAELALTRSLQFIDKNYD